MISICSFSIQWQKIEKELFSKWNLMQMTRNLIYEYFLQEFLQPELIRLILKVDLIKNFLNFQAHLINSCVLFAKAILDHLQ